MAELAPSFCMPDCCLYNARQPQTLRQNHSLRFGNLLRTLNRMSHAKRVCVTFRADGSWKGEHARAQ